MTYEPTYPAVSPADAEEAHILMGHAASRWQQCQTPRCKAAREAVQDRMRDALTDVVLVAADLQGVPCTRQEARPLAARIARSLMRGMSRVQWEIQLRHSMLVALSSAPITVQVTHDLEGAPGDRDSVRLDGELQRSVTHASKVEARNAGTGPSLLPARDASRRKFDRLHVSIGDVPISGRDRDDHDGRGPLLRAFELCLDVVRDIEREGHDRKRERVEHADERGAATRLLPYFTAQHGDDLTHAPSSDSATESTGGAR